MKITLTEYNADAHTYLADSKGQHLEVDPFICGAIPCDDSLSVAELQAYAQGLVGNTYEMPEDTQIVGDMLVPDFLEGMNAIMATASIDNGMALVRSDDGGIMAFIHAEDGGAHLFEALRDGINLALKDKGEPK